MNGRQPCGYLLPLGLTFLCLIEPGLSHGNVTILGWKLTFLSIQWVALILFSIWCFLFIYLSFYLADLLLLALLGFAVYYFFIKYVSWRSTDALTFIAGMTLGKGITFGFNPKNGLMRDHISSQNVFLKNGWQLKRFVLWITWFLTVGSWLQFFYCDDCLYHGPRWIGLWDDPNTYGMLMGAGTLLAIGLRAGMKKEECRMRNSEEKRKPPSPEGLPPSLKLWRTRWREEGGTRMSAWGSWNSALRVFLWIAIGMMGVGLVMSYSRGAWLATAVALVYLAWCYGKLKWRYVAIGVGLVALGILMFWSRTPDSAPWYLKHADLGRPSAQHRVAAWEAGLKIMRDHPFGVGWNNAVSLYEKSYSPPEDGAAALTTNDYMMIGTELGIPALLCFVAYVGLCFRKSPRIRKMEASQSDGTPSPLPTASRQHFVSEAARAGGTPALRAESQEAPSESGEAKFEPSHVGCYEVQGGEGLRAACLAGALVFVVAFWFDGGLFKLPTAALFWVLLELGAARGGKVDGGSRKRDR